MNPARRIYVSTCVKEGVTGAVVTCQGCWRRRWITWRAMGATMADDVELLSYRHRLRCSRCGGRAVYIKPGQRPE